MVSGLSEALFTLLNGNATLEAANGGSYQTVPAEVWNLPAAVTYPVLAFCVDDEVGNTPDFISIEWSTPRLRCWFVAPTRLECVTFADALRTLLNQQQYQLPTLGAQFIRWLRTSTTLVAATQKFQSYVEFHFVA